MFEVPLRQQMPAQVALMASLHHNHHRTGLGIVHARTHRHIPPVDGRLAGGVRLDLVNLVGIVAHDSIAAFPCHRATNRGCQAIAGTIVLESSLHILVAREREDVSPARAIPGRFDQSPALQGIADAEIRTVAAIEPTSLGPAEPLPRRPKYRYQKALHVARRDIDQQIANVAASDGLEVIAERVDVEAWNERRLGFEDMPCLSNELAQASRGKFAIKLYAVDWFC